MKRIETNQEFIKGAWSGLVAGIIMYFYVEIFRWLGVIKFGASFLAGDTVFSFKNNLQMHIIAFFIHIGVSMFWGVIFAFLFTKVFSGDYCYFKIIFMSFCIFFFQLGFLDEPFHYPREIHEQTLDLLIILSGYLFYGWVLAAGLKRRGIISQVKS